VSLVVVGDALLDRDVHGSARRLSPDAPVPVFDHEGETVRPGGAGLAAALAARDGHEVTLVTALADDPPAVELRAALNSVGVEVVDLGLDGATPQKVRFLAGEQQLLRVDRGGARGSVRGTTAGARAAISWAQTVLVSDYGRGVAAVRGVREAIAEAGANVPVVWDPHPNGMPSVAGAAVVTPNEAELKLATGAGGESLSVDEVAVRARTLLDAWSARAVCVTRGARGALLALADRAAPLAVPAEPVRGGDACGAGDRFSSRLAGALAQGLGLAEAVGEAVAAASLYVAAGGARAFRGGEPAGAPMSGGGGAYALAARARAGGGTVVATGGCFDLLHAGHVATLTAARVLGDCLIVCLNSDASVRRLKGPGRPVVGQAERAALLEAMGCVDAVLIFDDDTPEAVLSRLRPHVWAKGGDYGSAPIPEAEVVERGGGRVIVLPYLDGRSTTRLIETAGSSAR
jgi:rfaE bifunctional protein nucleotidyltransferase chain/domain/rfaE bifunctional protein kinase chain/domain